MGSGRTSAFCLPVAILAPQLSDQEKGASILVATPRRNMEMVETSILSMEATKYLPMDEADRMLEMGIEPPIRNIVDVVNPEEPMEPSTIFSADPEIHVLGRNIPPDPDESIGELAEHFFLVNHPDHYLTQQVVYNANKLAKMVKKKKMQNWRDYYQLKHERNTSKRPTVKVVVIK